MAARCPVHWHERKRCLNRFAYLTGFGFDSRCARWRGEVRVSLRAEKRRRLRRGGCGTPGVGTGARCLAKLGE